MPRCKSIPAAEARGQIEAVLSEAEIERSIIDGLRWNRITVLKTSRQRHKCPTCGTFLRSGDGCDRGVPDLIASVGAGVPLWVGLEVKTAKGRPSKEQAALAEEGRIVIVRSYEEALAAVERWQDRERPRVEVEVWEREGA